MRPKLGGRRWALALVLLAASFSRSVLPANSSPNRTVEYRFAFDMEGTTTVNVTYADDQLGRGAFWMLVPRGPEKWSLRVLAGDLENSTVKDTDESFGPMVFYQNLTLSYSGPFTAFVNWTLEYGALLLEPEGLFVSPAIFTSGDVSGDAKLRIPDEAKKVNYATPRYTKISDSVLQFDLKRVMREGDGRIYVFFSLYGQAEKVEFTRETFTVVTARRYAELAERVLSVYSKATPILQGLFNVTLGHAFVEFFVPSSAEELPIGGFVPILPDRFSVGNISLNLFYFRTQEGYVESIALHELVHQYCAKAGITPSLLWVHEGFANYVSIEITYLLGLPGASDLEESLEREAARIPEQEYGMVEGWTTSRTNPRYSEFQHYAVAFAIVKNVGVAFKEESDPFAGYGFFSDVFRGIARKGQRLNSTWQIVSSMESASTNGSRIASMFLSWNFDIPDVSQIYGRIESLRERLLDPPPILSFFAPSMLAKLVEAENSLENQNLARAQELVREVEAFVDRIWALFGTLAAVGATSIYLALWRKPREPVEAWF